MNSFSRTLPLEPDIIPYPFHFHGNAVLGLEHILRDEDAFVPRAALSAIGRVYRENRLNWPSPRKDWRFKGPTKLTCLQLELF